MVKNAFCRSTFDFPVTEKWTTQEKSNPFETDILGYRSTTDTILDFVRAGYDLTQFRNNGYFPESSEETDADSYSENYFEEISTSLDNLHDVNVSCNEKLNELSELSTELSTNESAPRKSNAKGADEIVENSVENSEESE